MSNKPEPTSERMSDWITIDTDVLTEESLHPFCFHSDGLKLENQVAIEMGMRIPASAQSGITSQAELFVRTIHSDNTLETELNFPSVSAEDTVVEGTGKDHPGLAFLEQTDDVAALTITTETTSMSPIELSTEATTSAASMFSTTNAGAIGSALNTLPKECTQDIYVQLFVVPLGEQDSVKLYGVGITIFVAHSTGDGASGAVPTADSVVRNDATTVFNEFTETENGATPRFHRVWRHSIPVEALIRKPILKPNPTRYRWVSQGLQFERVIQTIQKWSGPAKMVTRVNKVHPRIPHARHFIGTPAKIRVEKEDLAWLLGPPANSQDHQPPI